MTEHSLCLLSGAIISIMLRPAQKAAICSVSLTKLTEQKLQLKGGGLKKLF